MKKFLLSITISFFFFSCTKKDKHAITRYDGPEAYAAMEFKKTKDPALNKVPRERLVPALKYADNLRNNFNRVTAAGIWTERGSNSDTVGVSNGNTRANSGITSGRIRAVMVDANDASGNTVWVGGVSGGLWKTTNISLSPATWILQSDFFSNMSISSICQNPASPSTMYFATGEAFFNLDAVGGDGIWKSTNSGATWTQLASTTGASFNYCSKILCDNAGNVYVTTQSGVFRSANGGTSWTTITPTGLTTSRFSDMELSATGRLHISAGIFSTCPYRYTDIPATVISSGWTSPTSGYPTSSVRIELACSNNTLYALPSNNNYQVPTIYKSTDGGANWSATGSNPTAGWDGGQGWYALGADVNPADENQVIVGGLESYKTTDGGSTWARISRWVGTTGQYVHADIHYIKFYGTNRVLFGCDGGIHFSTDGGTIIRDKNVGLRLKQFYSCDFHPSTVDYFLAGAQDNGCHRFRTAGLAGSTEVIGGDGGFMHIDKNEPTYQFGTYVYNAYRRSINSGSNWSSCTFYRGSPGTYNLTYFDFGTFINPLDYDNTNNIMYGGADADEFFRWTTPQTTAAGTYYSATNFATANAAIIPLTGLAGTTISAITVSPYTANRVYFGSDNRKVLYLDNANTARTDGTNAVGTDISGASFPINSTVSCINTGTNDNNLMVCFSNYGVNNVWVSSNGGTSWTAIDGNLPDMPVRWCMFYPGDNTKAIIATEAGIWITELINGGSTSWYVSSTFPLVRTDMIKYRPSDGMIVAATHGRGLWTQNAGTVLPLNNIRLSAVWNNLSSKLQWNYVVASSNTSFEIQASYDGLNFAKIGNVSYNGSYNYSFEYTPARSRIFYRIRAIELNTISRYSNLVKLDKNLNQFELWAPSPNPVAQSLLAQYNTNATGLARFDIMDAGGKLVLSKSQNITVRGNQYFQTNVEQLAKGQYLLVMTLNDFKAVQKFTKN